LAFGLPHATPAAAHETRPFDPVSRRSATEIRLMSLELRNVVKRVGAETHIYETNLALEETGFNILLGTTLAGKTTLMQLMAGLERPTSGEVWFNGKNVTGVAVQRRNVSMVHQQFINYPNLSVFENIASPLRVARLARAEIKRRVQQIADLLKLSPLLKRRPGELSGGQQQRTALARALVKDADLVLLDEPLANLDFKLREELREELPRLFEDRGCIVVYATSEPTEALLLGGHTAVLHEGRITQFGETAHVYRQPVDLQSARVFSDPPINTERVTKQGDRFILNDQIAWPVDDRRRGMPDGAYTVGIRPHHISPTPRADDAVRLEGKVLVTELSGSESVIRFELQEQAWVSQSHGIHPFQVGARAELYIDVGQCMYFGLNDQLIVS
jgi:glycerol transport system ATP-binding protein